MYNHLTGKTLDTHTFFGNYRGEVVDNNDPLGAGRCKIRIFTVYDDLKPVDIPWSHYADPFMGGQVGSGGFFIPDVGAHVWCFFEAGNIETPVYFAGAPAKPHGPDEKSTGTYPNNRVIKTKSGHTIEIDDSPSGERINIKHMSGSNMLMLPNGDVEETVIGNYTQTISGTYTVNVTGNHTVNSGETVTVNSSSGTTTLDSVMTINDIVFDTHFHEQQPDSNGNTQPPTDEPQS